tara:strand:- start:774 stop:1472 length:699 start_codon:yes stop_codon:yes gene_type:complete
MAAQVEQHRVEVRAYPVGSGCSLCDRCGRRARFCGLGGTWCPSCWARRKRTTAAELADAAHGLAVRYGLDCWEQVAHSLADEHGRVVIRPSAAPVVRAYYHPAPAVVVDAILAEAAPWQRAQLQLQTISRALWGVALSWGEELTDYPRDGHHSPEAIPWGLVRWAESDPRAHRWLLVTALRLRSACLERFGRDCAAGRRVSWLSENTTPPPALPVAGPLRPPLGVYLLRGAA